VLAREAFESGAEEPLSVAERIFLSMPLLHAEDVALLGFGAEIARRIAASASPLLAKMCSAHLEQSEKYLNVIRRFGRFPHRNAVLGRISSCEEEAFLVDWPERAPPAVATSAG
jgi:uncharacterized protein (DUF924 family)